jgi:hypothetical protein
MGQASKRQSACAFSIDERLRHGSFSVAEAKALAGVSNTKFYADCQRGFIQVFKRGNASFVRGPDLARYMTQSFELAE